MDDIDMLEIPAAGAYCFLCMLVTVPMVLLCVAAVIIRICKPKVSKFNYKDKHIIITGGSSGIGLSLAQELLRSTKCRVTLLARNEKKLETAKERLLAKTRCTAESIATFSCDVTDGEAVRAVVQEANIKAGVPASVLLCSAGSTLPKLIKDTSTEDFAHILNTNVNGCYNSVKAFLSGQDDSVNNKEQSRICLVSSQAGCIGVIGYSAYSSSKFALRGLAEVLQMELRHRQVIVTLTHPPDTDTPGLSQENEERSDLLKNIAETSAVWPSDEVAKKILQDVKNGVFLSHFGFIGALLSVLTAGAAPVHHASTFFWEVFLAGVTRFISFFFHVDFNAKIDKFYQNRN